MRIAALLLLAIPPIVAAACGGGPEPVTPTNPTDSAAPSTSTAASSAPEPLPTAWSDDMPIKQQAAYMKANVAPRMGKLFQAHDSAKYANFGCVTCHGPNHENPHKFLPKLKMSGDGMKKLMAEKPDVVKFMHEQVEPEMASAMGQQPYDMKTQTGFGCKGCHSIE